MSALSHYREHKDDLTESMSSLSLDLCQSPELPAPTSTQAVPHCGGFCAVVQSGPTQKTQAEMMCQKCADKVRETGDECEPLRISDCEQQQVMNGCSCGAMSFALGERAPCESTERDFQNKAAEDNAVVSGNAAQTDASSEYMPSAVLDHQPAKKREGSPTVWDKGTGQGYVCYQSICICPKIPRLRLKRPDAESPESVQQSHSLASSGQVCDSHNTECCSEQRNKNRADERSKSGPGSSGRLPKNLELKKSESERVPGTLNRTRARTSKVVQSEPCLSNKYSMVHTCLIPKQGEPSTSKEYNLTSDQDHCSRIGVKKVNNKRSQKSQHALVCHRKKDRAEPSSQDLVDAGIETREGIFKDASTASSKIHCNHSQTSTRAAAPNSSASKSRTKFKSAISAGSNINPQQRSVTISAEEDCPNSKICQTRDADANPCSLAQQSNMESSVAGSQTCDKEASELWSWWVDLFFFLKRHKYNFPLKKVHNKADTFCAKTEIQQSFKSFIGNNNAEQMHSMQVSEIETQRHCNATTGERNMRDPCRQMNSRGCQYPECADTSARRVQEANVGDREPCPVHSPSKLRLDNIQQTTNVRGQGVTCAMCSHLPSHSQAVNRRRSLHTIAKKGKDGRTGPVVRRLDPRSEHVRPGTSQGHHTNNPHGSKTNSQPLCEERDKNRKVQARKSSNTRARKENPATLTSNSDGSGFSRVSEAKKTQDKTVQTEDGDTKATRDQEVHENHDNARNNMAAKSALALPCRNTYPEIVEDDVDALLGLGDGDADGEDFDITPEEEVRLLMMDEAAEAETSAGACFQNSFPQLFPNSFYFINIADYSNNTVIDSPSSIQEANSGSNVQQNEVRARDSVEIARNARTVRFAQDTGINSQVTEENETQPLNPNIFSFHNSIVQRGYHNVPTFAPLNEDLPPAQNNTSANQGNTGFEPTVGNTTSTTQAGPSHSTYPDPPNRIKSRSCKTRAYVGAFSGFGSSTHTASSNHSDTNPNNAADVDDNPAQDQPIESPAPDHQEQTREDSKNEPGVSGRKCRARNVQLRGNETEEATGQGIAREGSPAASGQGEPPEDTYYVPHHPRGHSDTKRRVKHEHCEHLDRIYRQARGILRQIGYLKSKEEMFFRAALRFQKARLELQEHHSTLLVEGRGCLGKRKRSTLFPYYGTDTCCGKGDKSSRCREKGGKGRQHQRCRRGTSRRSPSEGDQSNHSVVTDPNMPSTSKGIRCHRKHLKGKRRKQCIKFRTGAKDHDDDGEEEEEDDDDYEEEEEGSVSAKATKTSSTTRDEEEEEEEEEEEDEKKKRRPRKGRRKKEDEEEEDEDEDESASSGTRSGDDDEDSYEDDDESKSSRKTSVTNKKEGDEESESTDDDENDPRVCGFYRKK